MIAKARAVAHGNAYTTYSTLKKDAEFIGTLNMDCDSVLSMHPEDDAWEEFKNEEIRHRNRMWKDFGNDPNYRLPKREVTNTLIALEVSPTKEESEGWNRQDWFNFGYEVLAHMDDIELTDKDGKISSKKTNLLNSKALMMLHHDAKSGIPHLHIMVSRFDTEGYTNCANLIGMKAVIAANQINREQGWVQSRDISEDHKRQIKDTCYNILRRMPSWNFNTYIKELEKEGYKTKVNESNGKPVNYSIYWGNSRYAASSIGQHLTCAKLEKEWENIHEKKELEKKAEKERMARVTSERQQASKNSTPSKPMLTTECKDKDNNISKVVLPKHIFETIKENIELPDPQDYENEENGIPKIVELDEAIKIAVGIFFELLLANQVVPASGGGGGGPTGGWRDKDDDEWKRLAKLAGQRASAKCTPAHSKPKRTVHRGR